MNSPESRREVARVVGVAESIAGAAAAPGRRAGEGAGDGVSLEYRTPAIPSRPGGAWGWWTRAIQSPQADIIIPLLIFLLIAGATAWLWRLELRHERAHATSATELFAPAAIDRVRDAVEAEIRPITRLVRELGSGSINNPIHFVQSVSSVQQAVPSLETVAWLDHLHIVRALCGTGAQGELQIGQPLPEGSRWSEAHEKALGGRRRLNSSAVGVWRQRPAVWVCAPFRNDQRGRRGALLARLNLTPRLAEALQSGSWANFHVLVRDGGGRLVYTTAPDTGAHPAGYSAPQALEVRLSPTSTVVPPIANWTLQLRPTPQFVAVQRTYTPLLVLAGGLGIALLLSGAVAQTLVHRRRDRRQAASYVDALEALAKISAAISERPGEASDVLAQLARVAARLMNMSMSSVTLYDPADHSMHVVFRDGLPNPTGRDTFRLDEVPCSAQAMRTGRPLTYDDTEAPGSPFRRNPDTRGNMARYGVRSLVILPLIVGGNPMGVLLLAHGRSRRFSDLDRHLAELWMAEASAILSNRRLYEGMNAALTSLQRILHQRETLHEVNARIQHSTDLQDAMGLVAELAPTALDVDACIVCLAHADPGKIQIASITPGQATEDLSEGRVVECATCASVLRRGTVNQEQDLDEHPVRGFPHMGSALFVPLSSAGATIGLLALLRTEKGPFEDEQVRVAELFASRAAAAIENARLYEQTRRQAEGNATLLRELNHRVGNNFASIIGLLRVATSELPSDSRQGLERALQRVRMMARAHELLSSGVDSVPLCELVHTTLASVFAFEDVDVKITVALHDPLAKTFSSRAITLAMVLYELAFNAVEHALGGGGGELIVRSRRAGGAGVHNRIAIDVIDRPAVASVVAAGLTATAHAAGGDSTVEDPSRDPLRRHSGIGLQLVRNLVARELEGSFHMELGEEGGTIATVEFTLEEECECLL